MGRGFTTAVPAARPGGFQCTLMTLTLNPRASRPRRIQELGTMLYVDANMFGFTRQLGGQALLLLRTRRFVLMEWCAIGLRE